MKHLGVLENSLKCVSAFQIELEFGSVCFLRRETGVRKEKPLGARERTSDKLNPHNGIDASYYKNMQTVWIYVGVSIDLSLIHI